MIVPRPRRRRSPWTGPVTVALLVWFAVVTFAHLAGGRPHVGLVGLTVAAGAAVVWLLVDAVSVARGSSPRRWELLGDEPIHPPGQDVRLAALQRAVAGHLEARRPSGLLQRQLMGLVDQRLVARYGVGWQADPERVRPHLPTELIALAEQREPFPRMGRRQIDAILDRIEAL